MRSGCSLLASLLLSLLCASVQCLDIAGDADSFPGWLGASFDVPKRKGSPKSPRAIDHSRIIQLSASNPRAYLFKGFLTDVECDHIISKATPALRRSSVANNINGASELSEVRTSRGTFLRKGEDKVLEAIEQRISQWTFLPLPNQEPLQVLRYGRGEKYEPHFDYFSDPQNIKRGGHRYATVLIYLSNLEKGGETVFPSAKDPTPKDDSWSDCAKGRLAVKPRKGDALLFFSMKPDGTPDPSSLHHACPVINGVKWSAPKWIHVSDYDLATPKLRGQSSKGGCADSNALCSTWAYSGECNKNAEYMMDACKRSCKACRAST